MKCYRKDCTYSVNTNPSNNDGNWCCKDCKDKNTHGKNCQRTVFIVEEKALIVHPSLKCRRNGCEYLVHSNPANNDGTWCCRACIEGKPHGRACERRKFMSASTPASPVLSTPTVIRSIHIRTNPSNNFAIKRPYRFIHNPKTGGETVEALLKIKKNHMLARDLIKHGDPTFSFVFVRHPITRIISWYNHLLKHLYKSEIKSNTLNDMTECYRLIRKNVRMGPILHGDLAEKHDINSWIKIMFTDINRYQQPNWGPLGFQYPFVYDRNCQNKLVKEVLYFERYREELARVFSIIGRPDLIAKIDKTNHSISKNEPLTEESKNYIYEYFKKDFELFNYTKDNY